MMVQACGGCVIQHCAEVSKNIRRVDEPFRAFVKYDNVEGEELMWTTLTTHF
jgi:hypothetical protein